MFWSGVFFFFGAVQTFNVWMEICAYSSGFLLVVFITLKKGPPPSLFWRQELAYNNHKERESEIGKKNHKFAFERKIEILKGQEQCLDIKMGWTCRFHQGLDWLQEQTGGGSLFLFLFLGEKKYLLNSSGIRGRKPRQAKKEPVLDNVEPWTWDLRRLYWTGMHPVKDLY